MLSRSEMMQVLLEKDYHSLQDLAYKFSLDLKFVKEDFKVMKKRLKEQGKKLVEKPATCKACGFEFMDRKAENKPTKCPRCRNESIEAAKFRVLE